MKRRSGIEMGGFSLVNASGRLSVRDVRWQGETSRGQRMSGLCSAHVLRRSPLATGSPFTSLRTAPTRAARRVPRVSSAGLAVGRQDEGGWWSSQRSKGGGLGAARPGGVSPDTNSPGDCLCLANAKRSRAWHERRGSPVLLGAYKAGKQA